MALTVTPIPAFTDNYIWAIQADADNAAIDRSVYIVDPGDATPVFDYIVRNNLSLKGILVTHHHADHVGGIAKLTAHCAAPVFGPVNSPASALITHTLQDGDSVFIEGVEFRVMQVPGHTLDHIAFMAKDGDEPKLFCGDTLFSAGCGRLFEGTAEQLFNVFQRYKQLPKHTQIFPTHEYTLANLKFAIATEPNCIAIEQRIRDCTQLREQGLPTLPTTLAIELNTNPFMRTDSAAIQQQLKTVTATETDDEVSVFAALRRWKDRF